MNDSGGGQDLRQFGAGRGGFYTTERSCPGANLWRIWAGERVSRVHLAGPIKCVLSLRIELSDYLASVWAPPIAPRASRCRA